MRAVRIVRVSRVVRDLDRSSAFYRDGLGFIHVSDGPFASWKAALLGLPGAVVRQRVMRLGAEEVALVQFDVAGSPYPSGSRSDDLWFQHLAIVVDDMEAAYGRLSALHPQAISVGGPQVLPARNGGVSAFKFRDPDGHPLELIYFPPGQGRAVWRAAGAGPCLGIDHSALAVASTADSLRFYRRLGFRVAARSWNHGPAQSRLDGLVRARVRVTGLRPACDAGPGLELLRYLPAGRPAPLVAADAVLVDWVTVACRGVVAPMLRRDPDGHRMMLVGK